jgi:hypothetical protein
MAAGLSRRWAGLVALLAYTVTSFLYFGLPVVSHPGRSYIGQGADPQIFIWSFAWWPHAILHGQNPFVTHAIWAPTGVDLAWTATSPGLAILFAPLTLAAGPVVSYNVAALLMPALAAWTAFLLCRYLTRSFWPALVGGYLFGFSSYMLGQELGHLHLTSVALLPLVALVVLRAFRDELGGRGLVIRLGILLGAQVWLSSEVFFTATLALATALLVAYLSIPAERRRLVALLEPLVRAYAVAVLLAAPLLYFALRHFQLGSVNKPSEFATDLLNFVAPTRLVGIGGGWAHSLSKHFRGGEPEQGAYLGIPILVIAGWYAWRSWKAPGGRFLMLVAALAVIASLGGGLLVKGHRIVPLPWAAVAGLPLFDNVLTARLTVYVALAAAVIVALWASRPLAPRWLRIVLPVLAVLSLIPKLSGELWKFTPQHPAFFSSAAVRSCLAPGENVIVLPFGANADSMLWQTEAKFRFTMAGGYVSPAVPKAYDLYFYDTIRRLIENEPPAGGASDVVALARAEGAGAILVDAAHADPWRKLLARTLPSHRVGGMIVYPVSPGASASRACAEATT